MKCVFTKLNIYNITIGLFNSMIEQKLQFVFPQNRNWREDRGGGGGRHHRGISRRVPGLAARSRLAQLVADVWDLCGGENC